jgi:hypothetical protein
MRRLRLLALAALLISIQLVSAGCHKLGTGAQFVVYANEKDSHQIVAFQAAPQPWRQRWHGQPKEPAAEGKYFRSDGKDAVAGSFWAQADVYVLKTENAGKSVESRFSIQSERSLVDENGVVWRRTEQEIAEIQPWARPLLIEK